MQRETRSCVEMLRCALSHLRLEIHTQPVRDAIDVVEVGSDLHTVVDLLIAGTPGPELVQVCRPTIRGL
jgi:hypothetical protein